MAPKTRISILRKETVRKDKAFVVGTAVPFKINVTGVFNFFLFKEVT